MKKKIAICHAQVPFVRGGAELLVESLYEELRKRNYNAEVVSLPFKWYPNEQLIQSMMNWKFIDLSESNGEKIDLVIGTKFPSYGIEHNNKVTWLVHQFRQVYDLLGTQYSNYDYSPESLSVRELVNRYDYNSLSDSKKIYTIAQNTTDRLANYNKIDSEVLYHPPKHVGFYYSNNFDNYILSVGRLDKLKRVDILIESLKNADPKVKCIIAGQGPERENLESLASKLGLSDRVEFLGFVEDKQLLDLYANCLAVYFAPYDEDYGYITLEAFLSSKPIITLDDTGGVLEFVKDDVNGYVSSNSSQISMKIDYLYHNKKVAKEFGKSGHDSVKHISWDHVIDCLTETIR
ncbi:glycosyltransferase involved in cell wall biosynthesis [Fontibacillus phaseoli]|uniref:Glycosyltransferase involved in cell wall biosynthesis n=1 Tax=Fontibacillus phaseoli TaxID=1416533 RepID=A0A369BEH4_9BACL|nr:glycosyltransferase family 4 protein [Fontibacillus phaseoli]RCX19018.1 glycosyltransferase involved in cell wall biosynthesis [Fontibacillus phaseoli]